MVKNSPAIFYLLNPRMCWKFKMKENKISLWAEEFPLGFKNWFGKHVCSNLGSWKPLEFKLLCVAGSSLALQ